MCVYVCVYIYIYIYIYIFSQASLVAQLVKNLPAMWETWVWSLGWEDPLEKGKATPTSVFWPGEFHGPYSPWGHKELDTIEQLSLSHLLPLESPSPPLHPTPLGTLSTRLDSLLYSNFNMGHVHF